MVGKELRTRILAELERLPAAAQGRVLDFAQSLSAAPRGTELNGNQLADMFGLIGDDDAEDADDMQEAIETAFGMCAAEC